MPDNASPIDETAALPSAEPAAPAEPPAAATAPAADAAAPAVADLSPAACAAKLAGLFPALFGVQPPRPLKLHIQADIQQRAPGVFTRKSLSGFLHRHTTSTAYLKAMAAAAERVDLDGQPAGELADEHRQAAVTELQRRRASHDERRAAERAAARDAERQTRNAARDAERQSQNAAREAHRLAQEAAHRENEAEGQGRAERAALLRAFESTTLTRSNFCALKRIPEAELDAALAQARQDREKQALAFRAQAAAPAAPAARPARPERPPADGRAEREPRRPPRRPPAPPKPSE